MNSALAPTLLNQSLPRINERVRDILLVVGGSLFVASMAQVRIPLPFTPVPITGQTFAVLLVGAALGTRRSVASLVLYLAMGLVGLPVFAGGASGLAILLGPTGGYLAGFILAAALVGTLSARGMDRRVPTALLAFLVGEIVIYFFGIAWLSVFLGWQQAILAGLLPFLVGDAIKLAAAGLALPAAWKLVK